MLSLWNVVTVASLVCRLSPVSGWALDLREFGSCNSVHLGLLNSSHKYSDWATNIIATNPYTLWTITTRKNLQNSVQLSIHAKRSLCTLNIVITGGEFEEKDLIHYVWGNLNTYRPHMHSTYIAIREDNNRISAPKHQVAFRLPFHLIFAVVSHHEESLRFYYFCPVCQNPMQPIHNELSKLSNKKFQSDWNPVVVSVISGVQEIGFSSKQCLRYPSSPTCLDVAIVEVLSHHLNFTISYQRTGEEALKSKHGCIQLSTKNHGSYNTNVSLPLKFSVQTWFFKYKGFFLFYCIPTNVTNIVEQEGIHTWVSVFENKFSLVFISSLFLIALVCSLPSVSERKIRPAKFLKTLGRKCFYIFSALTRQDIPSTQRAMWGFSFIVALVLYVYENEFTSYVIVEIAPPPFRSSPDVIANNYTVVYHVFKEYYEDPNLAEKEAAELIQDEMINRGFLKSKSQFEVRFVENGASEEVMMENQIRSALFEKVALIDRNHLFVNSLSIFPMVAESTHQTNWMSSDSVCYVTESDITINPIIWFPVVFFKFKLLKTINMIEQTGIEGYWNDQFYYNQSFRMNGRIRMGDYADIFFTPLKRKDAGLVSMKQLRPMVVMCLSLMGLAGVTFLIENVHGRTHQEVLDFFHHTQLEMELFIMHALAFLSQLLKGIWRRIVGGKSKTS